MKFRIGGNICEIDAGRDRDKTEERSFWESVQGAAA